MIELLTKYIKICLLKVFLINHKTIFYHKNNKINNNKKKRMIPIENNCSLNTLTSQKIMIKTREINKTKIL